MALSLAQAIEKIGVPRSTFTRKVKSLNIPTINKGGKIYFEEEILEKFFPSKGKELGKIISFANQKGGPGKTTTCLNVSIALSHLGYKILVIDFDPQANLTGQFIPDPEGLENTISNLLDLKNHGFHSSKIENTIIQTNYFDLIPSNISLANFETSRDLLDYDKLSLFTKSVRGLYDYILIDCGPTLDVKLLNALVCSDLVIVPSTPSKFSVQGLNYLKNTIEKAKSKNNTLQAFGLINQFVPQQQLAAMIEGIEDYFYLFDTKIPRATDIEKVQVLDHHLDTHSKKIFKHYLTLAKEIIEL